MAIPPLIFERARVRHNLARAQRMGAGGPLLEEAETQLLERLVAIRRIFKSILVTGPCNPAFLEKLHAHAPQARIVHGALAGPVGVILDEEALPFAAGRFDLILACMNMHAINDVPGALIQMRRALQPDGLVLAAFIGGDSLHELRAALQEAELASRGGAAPRVAPFIDVRDAGMLLVRAGFALPVADRTQLTLTYSDAFALMHELRHMGAGNALVARDKRFAGRAFFMRAAELYRERFIHADGRIAATIELVFLAGWAPHASQQTPLKPGQATLYPRKV